MLLKLFPFQRPLFKYLNLALGLKEPGVGRRS